MNGLPTGRYIAFEGMDSSVKSTQLEHLKRRLGELTPMVVTTREPGSPHIGFNVRDFVLGHQKVNPQALELLFQADRAEHTAWILDKVAEGYWVLSDRSYISGLAYALSWGHKPEELQAILQFSIRIRPDTLFFLDLPVAECQGRMNRRSVALTREEVRGAEAMRDIYGWYRTVLAGEVAGGRTGYQVIDARGAPEDVAARIWCALFPQEGSAC